MFLSRSCWNIMRTTVPELKELTNLVQSYDGRKVSVTVKNREKIGDKLVEKQ